MSGSLGRFLLFLIKVKDANDTVLFPLPPAFEQLTPRGGVKNGREGGLQKYFPKY